jgi:pyruvate,water dikinase
VIKHDEILLSGDQNFRAKLELSLSSLNITEAIKAARDFISTVNLNVQHLPSKFYAVRSSSNLEDSDHSSFAGIFATKLFVHGDLSLAIREVWFSLFSEKAIAYYQLRGLRLSSLKMDIIVQEMIDGEKSGVMFQENPIKKSAEEIIVAGLGICEGIVSDETDTDQYVMENDEIKSWEINEKKYCLRFNGLSVSKNFVSDELKCIPVLSLKEIERLMTLSFTLRSYFDYPLDIEFSFKAEELFILQVRPITARSNIPRKLPLNTIADVFTLQGIPCSGGVVEADCIHIADVQEGEFPLGKIIIANKAAPLWGHLLTGISGIILESGSILSHAALIARELGIPCIIGVKNASRTLKTGTKVFMDGSRGQIRVMD